MPTEGYFAIFGIFYYLFRLLRSYSIEKTIEIEERRAIVSSNVRLDARVKQLEEELETVLLTTKQKLLEYDKQCKEFQQQILDMKIEISVLRNNQENKK